MAQRVRVIVHALDRTGPPMLARSAVVGLVDAGYEVDVVSVSAGQMITEMAAVAPVRVLLDPRDSPVGVADGSLRERGIARAAGLPDPDLVLLVSVAGLLGLDALQLDRDVPLAAWVVEQGEDLRWLDDRPDWRERVDHWWAGTGGTAAELKARWGIDALVVPEFIADPEHHSDRHRLREAAGVGPGEVMVLGAGIATLRKGADLFVEIAAAARRRGRGDLRFVWLGGVDDALFEDIAGDLRQPGRPDVRYVGIVPDVRPWIAAADVFVHPARLDAYPLVCLEAAGTRVPAIGFRGLSAQEEMFGDAALTVRFPDVEAMAERVAALVDDPQERERVAAAQHEAVVRSSIASVAVPRLVDAVARAITGVRP